MNDYVTKPVIQRATATALDICLRPDSAPTASPTPEVSQGTASARMQQPEIPVFDRTGMMARVMTDEDVARAVAAVFRQDIPRQIAVLNACLETGDASGVERQAHTIKGAAANVGGEALRAVAFAIEKVAKVGDLCVASGYTAELEAQFHRLEQAMATEL